MIVNVRMYSSTRKFFIDLVRNNLYTKRKMVSYYKEVSYLLSY